MHRFLPLLMLVGYALPVSAQEPYRDPPPVVQQILDAPRLPSLITAPGGERAVFATRDAMPSIADLARPMLRLAGLRINPETNARFTVSGFHTLAVRDLNSGATQPVDLPDGARVTGIRWSPDGNHLAVVNERDDGVDLWVASRDGAAARHLVSNLNGVFGAPCAWLPDSVRLVCRVIPADRGAPPAPPAVPTGPIVQRNTGRSAPVRTYQDMLATPYDETLFDYYATSQVVIVDVSSGTVTPIGAPGVVRSVDPAPGGDLLLVTRVERPYSYQVPYSRFPQTIDLWTLEGERVVTIARIPLAETVPIGGVRTGPRNFSWRPDQPATLIYVEALDGGNTRRPADERDRVVSLAAPFTSPVELGRLELRYAGLAWGRDGVALVSEYERSTRRLRTWKINADDPSAGWRIIVDRSTEDRYNDPGSPVMTRNAAGQTVLLQSPDGDWIYLRGAGASPEGDRPFLDRFHLEDRKSERLWQSGEDVYETVVAVLDPRGRTVITRQESRTSPPNYLFRDLRRRRVAALTELTNPSPALAQLRREVLHYQREDGVELSGTLYYPTDYQEGQRVPVIFWIYPREFASAAAAGQVRGSPNRFVLPTGASRLFLLTQGYAVLDNPTLPVIGGDTANNTYVEQTVAGAEAAIAHLMEMGIADGNFGVAGHSYGAFATANLLAHSDLFKAGVARSGAYNRTLTPFGFQNEQRTFWQAPDVYFRMMPFAHADKINEPILLIHGINDNNSGTFPVQSERMYHALKGHGATVEYVQLPYESHGYVARESVGDVIARMIEWFDQYVKGGEAASGGGR